MILYKRKDGFPASFPAGRPDRIVYEIKAAAMRSRRVIHNCPAIEGALRC